MLNQKIQLKNGVQIPTMGLGTWQIPDEIAQRAVKDAISVGYKHIDTAVAYGNESGVGRGIKESGIKREDVFKFILQQIRTMSWEEQEVFKLSFIKEKSDGEVAKILQMSVPTMRYYKLKVKRLLQESLAQNNFCKEDFNY